MPFQAFQGLVVAGRALKTIECPALEGRCSTAQGEALRTLGTSTSEAFFERCKNFWTLRSTEDTEKTITNFLLWEQASTPGIHPRAIVDEGFGRRDNSRSRLST